MTCGTGRIRQKVTQHVTMLGGSHFVARGVPILKIAAIIAPGKCWGALPGTWHATCYQPPARASALLGRSIGQASSQCSLTIYL